MTMTTISFRSEAFARGARMLRTALGPSISGYLEDPSIVEVMLNPDGRLWIDRLSGGLEDTRLRVAPADAERIVRLVAHHVGVEVHAGNPRVSAELPESGERFEGLVPPVVAAPCFAIRRQAVAVFTLDDYVAARIMSALQAELLRAAVRERKNILVAGGTSTGKTTLRCQGHPGNAAGPAHPPSGVLRPGTRGISVRLHRTRAGAPATEGPGHHHARHRRRGHVGGGQPTGAGRAHPDAASRTPDARRTAARPYLSNSTPPWPGPALTAGIPTG